MIVFIAGAGHQFADQSGQNEISAGPAFSLEILNHAAKLLSSVPSKVTPSEYFSTLAPQLFALLDEEGTDMQRAAAYIIGNGILGRRIYGAPGSAGWTAFVAPLFNQLLPEVGAATSQVRHVEDNEEIVLVGGDSLSSAVHRLAALVLIHPNPGLVKRLLDPLILPIWAVMRLSHASASNAALNHKVMSVLDTYISVSAGATGLMKLADNLLWDGGLMWKFGFDHTGRLEIHRRHERYRETDIEVMFQLVDESAQRFIELQGQAGSDSDVVVVFAHLVSCWLLGPGSGLTQTATHAGPAESNDPVRVLTYAKLTQGMLERYKEEISTDPDQIFKLLQQILTSYVTKFEHVKSRGQRSQHVTLASLSSIVHSTDLDAPTPQAQDESEEIVSVSLGLLDALLPFPGSDAKESTLAGLRSILETLNHLTALSRVPQSILLSATNTANQISEILDGSSSLHSAADQLLSPYASALTARSVALQNLSSPLPPIRAEGLASLTQLIASSTPILDIPSTTILFLSLLQDDEEFIYLAAVKAVALLAGKHPRTVTRLLVERYVDKNEEGGLDLRLRIGEALQATVGSLGPMLRGDSAALIGESLISLAGRRGSRPKTAAERQKRNLAAENEKQEAERAWGGEVPNLNEVIGGQDEAAARVAEVLSSWEGEEGEEDVRIRTSALSILGVGFETDATGMGPDILSMSIDLAVAILRIETAEEKAILRRASVLLLMSIIRGIEKSDEKDPKLNYKFWFPGESINELMEVLGYLDTAEKDTIVRGHMGVVMQGVRDYMANEWRRSSEQEAGEVRFGLEWRLKGLNVNPERNTNERAKPRIEEVE